jgi:hypothetical protein
MRWVKYTWKYYIWPLVTFMDPTSLRGLRLREQKLLEDDEKK